MVVVMVVMVVNAVGSGGGAEAALALSSPQRLSLRPSSVQPRADHYLFRSGIARLMKR